MIMEDFVTLEITKKLKEKGFPIKTKTEGKFGLTKVKKIEILPTISQVLKWLREEKKLHIAVDVWGRTWGYDVIELTGGRSLHWTAYCEDIKSYEDAALAGIKYILDNLI